jgi:hypothetical protein
MLMRQRDEKCEMEINGKNINVELIYSFDYEEESPDFDYGSKEENEKELKRFDDGELLNLWVNVRAYALGQVGQDSLGQCFISAKKFDADFQSTVDENSMKENALDDLKKNIIDGYKTLVDALGELK